MLGLAAGTLSDALNELVLRVERWRYAVCDEWRQRQQHML